MFSAHRMSRILFRVLSVITLSAFAVAIQPPLPSFAAEKVTIPAGTIIGLRTTTPLSPEHLNVGDLVMLAVISDVLVDGVVVIKGGAPARGEIVSSKSRNMIGIAAKIGLSVRSLEAVDGTTIPMYGTKLAEGKSKMGASIGLSLICCVLFALMKGGDASIASGTEIQATTAGTTVITVGG